MIQILIFVFVLILFICLITLIPTQPPNYDDFLSVLTIAKNESMVIKEFIENNKWQGVDRIYLIDNGSTDNMKEVLQPYIDDGYVHYYYLPEPYQQESHYNKIFPTIKNRSKWLAVIDVDEYILGTQKPFRQYLEEDFENEKYIEIYWTMFGSSGHEKQPDSVRESFTMKSDGSHHNLMKYVCKTRYVEKVDVHHAHTASSVTQKKSIEHSANTIRIHHYCVMSKEYFMKVKATRGDAVYKGVVRNEAYFHMMSDPCNKIEDTTMKDIYQHGYKNAID